MFIRLTDEIFDRMVIDMYKEPVKKVHVIEVGWLTWYDFVNRYGVSAFRLYNQYFLSCSVETVYIVDPKWPM